MNDLGINSVMLDTSFCIRLMDKNDPLHPTALDYFKYFLNEKISMHISTVAIAEYAVGDDPSHLPLHNVQIEAFDFLDAVRAGLFHKEVRGNQYNIQGYSRRIIANDIKIFSQLAVKKIDAIISRDVESLQQYINPLIKANLLQVIFLDLNVTLKKRLGTLF